jgi:hypothetical protein
MLSTSHFLLKSTHKWAMGQQQLMPQQWAWQLMPKQLSLL